MKISGNFECFQYFTDILETKTIFKKLKYRFLVENTKIEKAYFHTELPYQKPMLKQIE